MTHRSQTEFIKKNANCVKQYFLYFCLSLFSLVVGLHVFHPQRDSAVRVPVSYFSFYSAVQCSLYSAAYHKTSHVRFPPPSLHRCQQLQDVHKLRVSPDLPLTVWRTDLTHLSTCFLISVIEHKTNASWNEVSEIDEKMVWAWRNQKFPRTDRHP